MDPAVIGKLVKELWGDKVQKVRRGPQNARKRMYFNLSRRTINFDSNSCTGASPNPIFNELKTLQLPLGWNLMENTPDNVSFVRIETWEFRKERGNVEVVCKKAEGVDEMFQLSWTVRTHGCECIKPDLPLVNGLGLSEQVNLILEYVDRSSLCPGFSVPEGESLRCDAQTICGPYRNHATDSLETRAFSQDCTLFSRPGSRCAACFNMVLLHNQKNARKLSSPAVHPFCNKRYLNKDEVVEQLKVQQERRRKAEKREEYWRSKFKDDSVDMEEQDHQDLCAVFDSCTKEKKRFARRHEMLVGAAEKDKCNQIETKIPVILRYFSKQP